MVTNQRRALMTVPSPSRGGRAWTGGLRGRRMGLPRSLFPARRADTGGQARRRRGRAGRRGLQSGTGCQAVRRRTATARRMITTATVVPGPRMAPAAPTAWAPLPPAATPRRAVLLDVRCQCLHRQLSAAHREGSGWRGRGARTALARSTSVLVVLYGVTQGRVRTLCADPRRGAVARAGRRHRDGATAGSLG